MKNYSSNRAQKGKTAYRTPSRRLALRSFAKVTVKNANFDNLKYGDKK